MNKKFDHLESLVRQLKRDRKILKDQNAHLTKLVNELKASVSKLESQNKEQEMKTERLEAQSRRDNLRFMGSMIKVMNLGKNRRPECEITSMSTLTLTKLPSKSKERIISEVKTLHDPL